MRRSRMTSITSQVRRSVTSIAVLLAVPALIGLAVMLIYSARTQAMIRRMDAAAGMKPALESTIAENLFSVAAGRTSFGESGVEELIAETDRTLDVLLAEKIGITQANLSILKTGKAKAVRFSTLEAICRTLRCQPGDILEYTEDETDG